MNDDFWKLDANVEAETQAKAFALGINLDMNSNSAFESAEDAQRLADEICEMEDAEWVKKARALFYVPPQRTTNNRKKKQRRK
jgi:hypothetical protein